MTDHVEAVCPALEERCALCGCCSATHKVGEEPTLLRPIYGHNLTAYLCCDDFGRLMGVGAGVCHLRRAREASVD